ncbi:MAG: alpha-glucan family phosphorylase [Anaerolineales bacterium]
MNSDLFPHLPPRIAGLSELAYNLWWSWQPDARNVFRTLGVYPWRESGHNPIRLLASLPEEVLTNAANDPQYLNLYDRVMQRFNAHVASNDGWFESNYGKVEAPLVYMSFEYGLHPSLPIYAGGLGILAGDHLKEASDLCVPIVAVGMIYSDGYVQQRIGDDGWQGDIQTTLDRTYDPIMPVLDDKGKQLIVQMPIFDPPLYVAVWKVAVGRVSLYLMDTDLEINQPWERAIAQVLYAGNNEQRLKQEIVLGMGGIRVLEALNIHPAALHLNEGHPAFAILERIRQRINAGENFDQAFKAVRESTIFTTHTPVAAGTDVFPYSLMEQYFGNYLNQLQIDKKAFFDLGVNPQDPNSGFNMTVFAMRAANYRNAVSQRHAQVARRMWANLWQGKKPEEIPIISITNGVHLPTWIELVQFQPLLNTYLGENWFEEQDLPQTWEKVDQIPDKELWHLHQDYKATLLGRIDERTRLRWHRDKVATSSVLAFGALLDPEILTIGFARRMTGYKRADLVFYDFERIKRLLNDPIRPMQIIFAGLAHPADNDGKRMIQRIFRLAQDPECAGRIAFVEDYDQQLAQYLVHGVDVWLNNPLPPLEASGTSGMKAAINGTPNLSILDGWWIEGFNGENGWGFGGEEIAGDRSVADAAAIYQILEEKVIPMYYERSDDGVPHDFVKVMKASIKSVAPQFSTRRMVKEYVQKCYAPALGLTGEK